jgi:hypothetical protein
MPFGYLGTTPNQQLKNSGVFSVEEALQVQKDGEWGGSLQLIAEQTISNSLIDFTSLQENKYDVLVFKFIDVKPNATGNIGMRLSNDGGSSYGVTNYQYAWQRGKSSGSFDEIKNTNKNRIIIAGDVTTTGSYNLYLYCYNFGNSSKYSFVNTQVVAEYSSTSNDTIINFGGGVQPTAEVHNAVRFGTLDFNALASGTIKLFGVKQI